ncbi:MAG TPA: sigma factor-like helix-turn-helix DNA-binding protein [Polyangiales bacterium]
MVNDNPEGPTECNPVKCPAIDDLSAPHPAHDYIHIEHPTRCGRAWRGCQGPQCGARSHRLRGSAAPCPPCPDEQREVFLLRHVQNLPFGEIAEICGVPENTVKSRMRYALERLQSALGEYEEQARALG